MIETHARHRIHANARDSIRRVERRDAHVRERLEKEKGTRGGSWELTSSMARRNAGRLLCVALFAIAR
jgi:hypothetical protein